MVIARNLGIQPKYEKFEKSRYFEKSYFPTFSGKFEKIAVLNLNMKILKNSGK